ncbi:hypothetical protein [Lewinella sp. W8]|uniref:hypothetical protein n=1 Tax=Lewinella sp. W8 TaxID=2528208 RepID=UPI0010687955|nr:hypothetical protein [Lewinella sp. W8]MTB50455.1 hypothetical protein [Lewinella sp. W8]
MATRKAAAPTEETTPAPKDKFKEVFPDPPKAAVCTPPGKIAEALKGKLQGLADAQAAMESGKPEEITEEKKKIVDQIAEQKNHLKVVDRLVTFYSGLADRKNTSPYLDTKLTLPTFSVFNKALEDTGTYVASYKEKATALSPLLITSLKSTATLIDGIEELKNTLLVVREGAGIPSNNSEGEVANDELTDLIEASLYVRKKGSNLNMLAQVDLLEEQLETLNDSMKATAQQLHGGFDAENIAEDFAEILQLSKDFQAHIEEKRTGNATGQQTILDKLKELRASLFAQQPLLAAATQKNNLKQAYLANQAGASILRISVEAKKAGGDQDAVPVELTKDKTNLNKAKDEWDNAVKAVEKVEAEIKLLTAKKGTYTGYRESLEQTKNLYGKLYGAVKSFAEELTKIKGTICEGDNCQSNQFLGQVNTSIKLINYLKQMEVSLNELIRKAEGEFDESYVATLLPVREKLEALAEPAAAVLEQFVGALNALSETTLTLGQLTDLAIKLPGYAEGANPNAEADKILGEEDTSDQNTLRGRLAVIEKDIESLNKEESGKLDKAKKKVEEKEGEYENQKAKFDFNMMLLAS